MADKQNEMKYEADYDDVEPPELKRAGVPPLKKQISWLSIGIAVALVIVMAFAIYFYLSNRH